jgi:hypothetical protein
MAVLVMPARPASRQSGLSSIKTVFVILFENTNWASITPSVAPYGLPSAIMEDQEG